jgi:Domain of unknown function (DUF309)
MPPPLPLGLRNGLAELILDAFDSPEARAALAALVQVCDGKAVEPEAGGRLRLRGASRAHRDAVRQRAAAALGMLERPGVARDGATLPGALDRAARLADASLFFEVHELLEPVWLQAEGAERLALQGLIQVAVGFHHAAHGNRKGAISLLEEGVAKLRVSASSLPLDTAAWLGQLETVLAAWQAGSSAPAPTPWPAPTEAAWRSS